MGLLDRNKRKQPAPAQPAPAAGTPAAPQATPISSADSESLRDMLIAAVSARDQKLVGNLVAGNREAIVANFSEWQKVPEPIRNNGGAMQRYANTLVALAELFRDKYGDMSLIEKLSGPKPQGMQAQWEQAIGQAETFAKELKFEEAKSILTQVITALADVPMEGPVPFHAVTHGRLGHTLLSMGDPAGAAEHMGQALKLSQQRGDDAGVAAALRGMYEINRYQGKIVEAAEFGERLSALLLKKENAADAEWWAKQSARTRAGEPPCRVVFFVGEKQFEVDEVPKLSQGQVRYGFVRNRPPIVLCEALVHGGMQLASQTKFEEALGQFREAGRVDPYDPNSHYQAAVTLMHLERPAEAVEEFDATDKLAPGWFNCRSERWIAAEIAAGRIEPAIFFVLRTEEMPETGMSWEQKLSLVDQAITRVGELPPLLLYRARCLLRLARIAEAEPVLRTGVEKAAEPDVRTRLIVDLQMITQDPQEKLRLLKEAIALNGNLAASAVARVAMNQLEMEFLSKA